MSANIPSSTDDPDTVYGAAKTRGLIELRRFILRLCPSCEPSGDTLCGLNYPHRRTMLVLLFCSVPVKGMHPWVVGLRELKSHKREGLSMLRHIASYL